MFLNFPLYFRALIIICEQINKSNLLLLASNNFTHYTSLDKVINLGPPKEMRGIFHKSDLTGLRKNNCSIVFVDSDFDENVFWWIEINS